MQIYRWGLVMHAAASMHLQRNELPCAGMHQGSSGMLDQHVS